MTAPRSDLLSSVLDSVPFAITTVDPEGTILFVNAAAAHNLSGDSESVIGKSVYDFFPSQASATRERIRQTVRSRTVQRFEAVVTLPDGRERYFDSAYCPTLDGDGEVVAVQIVAQDVTELRRPRGPRDSAPDLWGVVTDDLSMTAERVRAILASTPMVVSVFDRDMTIRYMSRLLRGIRAEDVIGRSPMFWVAEASRPALKRAFDEVLEHQQVAECEVEGQSGRAWLVRLAPLMHEGKVEQILGCTLDVTEQRRLQEQLAHKRQLESLGTMASGIAHDFNNLLTAILGNVALARLQAAGGADAMKTLGEIETAACRAAELCEQMLVFAGRRRRGQDPGQLNDVIEEMLQLSQAAVSAKIELWYDLAPGLPATSCPGAQLGQVVLNLLKNAADAIGDGPGRIAVTTSVVEHPGGGDFLPEPPPAGRYVRLEVTDDGPGMSPEAVHRIFEPFYSTKTGGHGLGLSVVMGIASSHDAAVEVSSTLGEGTTMTVLFPIHEGPTSTSERPDHELRGAGEGTILVVDDEAPVRRVAAAILTHAGYEVLQAADGDEALALLDRHGSKIRAILLDVTMPRRDGLVTLEGVRRTHPRLPVVLSSGRPTEGGGDDPHVQFLPKPYRPDALTDAIAKGIRNATVERRPVKTAR